MLQKYAQSLRFSFFYSSITLILLLTMSGSFLAPVLPSPKPISDLALPLILPKVEEPEFLAPAALADDPITKDARALADDVAELPEMMNLRTSDSATFQLDDARYVTILSDEAMHYQDQQGAWRIIDPAFRPVENSFVVEHNSIRSRAGFSEARLSAAVGNTGIIWQATALGTVSGDHFSPLAEALAEPPNFAQKGAGDRVLRYDGNWSDPSLSEEIVSAPGSLEHVLVLSEPPQTSGEPEYLEMQATLKLLPGVELWANGQAQSGEFQTTGNIEIHDAGGTVLIIFDPVLAFEQDQPARAVEGLYVAQPTDEPNTWSIGVRTPWQWWSDPERNYPAVIDPTMHVLQPTGQGNGIAWVGQGYEGSPDTSDSNLHFGEMMLGAWYQSEPYKNYIQFNSMPFMLTNATPFSVTAAYLDIEPSHIRMPGYHFSDDECPVDWASFPTQHNATLYSLGSCPDDCGGFSLLPGADLGNFDWANVPSGLDTGVEIGTYPLVSPPARGGGQTVTTSWDVTQAIRTWTLQSPRPAGGPTFQLIAPYSCPVSTFNGTQANYVPTCSRVVVPPQNIRLRIEYDVLPIAVNQSFLNNPGVPSFYEGVFAETSHQYELDMSASSNHWRAVAVRGNHAIEPGLPTRTGMKLVERTIMGPVNLVDGATLEPDKTAIVLMDEHNPANLIEAANLWVEVTASNQNDFSSDEERNYRIEHQRATDWDVNYSTWTTKTISFKTDRLISLGEFDLNVGDSVLIRVTAPLTLPLELGLAAPSPISIDKAYSALGNANLDTDFGPKGILVRTKDITFVQTQGTWALAMMNQGRPVSHPARPNSAIAQQVTVEILRCALGSVATARWDCQPVKLPDAGTFSRAIPGGLTVYSEGDFEPGPGDDWCTKDEAAGTPMIGPDVDGRWVVVGQGTVCRNGDTISTTSESGIGLAIHIPSMPTHGKIIPTFVYGSVGYYPLPDGYETGVVVRTGESGQLVSQTDTRRNLEPFDLNWGTVFDADPDYISIDSMMAVGGGTVDALVSVDAAAAPEDLVWDVPWTFYPEETALRGQVFTVQASQSPALPQPALLASLELRMLDSGETATGVAETLDHITFESGFMNAFQFRANRAKITQDVKLGGATKNAIAVIMPPGQAYKPDNEKSCFDGDTSISCLDLRRDDYKWDTIGGDKSIQLWELPDVHVEDSAGLIMFSRPGQVQIFSNDHPHAMADVDQSFSFDTFGASVSITEEPCTEDGPVVTVVKGSASIGLPSVGDDGSGGAASASIVANFKLCSSKLRQAQLILTIPTPGIPVGSTGVGVNMIGGTVTIDPDYTQIEIQLGFQTLDGVTVSNGIGSVMIDTRGLFQLEASATIVGLLDAELLFQVAWNPLDILLEARVSCCGGLISGGLRLHAWIGQGWQNKYDWLPNNDDFHFTGSIEATLTIPEGYIADLGLLELPPFTFSIGIRIAFGEFCTNSSCTEYDWGMSGVLSVCGYDVGLYVDSSGPELILGSDDHVLIDQFGGALRQRAKQPRLAPDDVVPTQPPGHSQIYLARRIQTPADDWPIESASLYGCTGEGTATHVCPFTVTEGAGRAMFTVNWENGDLDVALITPGSTVILPSNAISNSIAVSETSTLLVNQIVYGVPQEAIVSGAWQLQLSNVITDPVAPFQTNYQIFFTTEAPPPALVWDSPVVSGTTPDGSGLVNLEWTALRSGQPLTPGAKIELVYLPIDSKPITPTLISGTLIANRIEANLGTFAWDTSGLASGEYAVGGSIDDHLNANGHIVAWAPGTIVVNDVTPPPIPKIIGQFDIKDALFVFWKRDNLTPDLAGYLVKYTIPEWYETDHLPKVRRVLPHSEDEWPFAERIRLGGLLSGLPTTVCVQAYDASGNVSDCEPFDHTLSLEPIPPLGAPQRLSTWGGSISVGRDPETYMRVRWAAPDSSTGTPDGYYLSYHIAGCVGPNPSSLADQGPSPIDSTSPYTLTGLTVGQTYRIAVNAYNDWGFVGPKVETFAMFIDYADADFDGMPDQWVELYNITDGPGGDADGDGLTNLEEYGLKSNPRYADSDSDGYYDGEEVDWGSNVCGPEHPPYHAEPKLTLAGNGDIEFTIASNQVSAVPQIIQIHNLGGGTLDWTAVSSDPWIIVGSDSGSGMSPLPIGVDTSELGVGHYIGTITIRNVSPVSMTLLSRTSAAQQEEVIINVELDVIPPKDFVYTFLPLVSR